MTIRSGPGKASGLSKTAFTTLKTGVLAPIPSAMTATASSVKPGFFHNDRNANLKSMGTVKADPVPIAGALESYSCGQQKSLHCSRVGRPCSQALTKPMLF